MEAFIQRVLSGETRAAARLLRCLDDGDPQAKKVVSALYRHGGQSRTIGITGHPGAGKSTLTDSLISAFRGQGKRVAVVAIDPSSPFSGGAILGDRIRMQHHSSDGGVFIRSLATRGVLGGLTASTRDSITVFEAMAFDIIIVETVGVGQDEVDVASMVETSAVVTVPGLGDGVQMIKAGLMEIADVFVLNKNDNPLADRAARELNTLIELEGEVDGWTVPLVRTTASTGDGITELVNTLETHEDFLANSAEGDRRRRIRVERMLSDILYRRMRERAAHLVAGTVGFEGVIGRLLDRSDDPYGIADELLAKAPQ